MLLPQVEVQPEDVLPRELLFVFDRSGSMAGESIVQARNALHGLLRALNPGDTFNIIPFDHKIEQFAPQPLPFTQEHIDRADAYIEHLYGRGGTEILKALQAALHQPRDPKRMRVIVFLTDGAVANEDQVLRQVQGSLNEARVYAFGVGTAVNRFLLDKLAQAGRGSVDYIFPGQSIEEAVQRFQNRAAFPLLVDTRIEWGSSAITDMFPTPLPDLYAGQPLTILARFHRGIHTTLRLTGHTANGSYEQMLEFELPEATPDRSEHWAALPQVWARARIDELMDVERYNPREKNRVRDEILGLALAYRLLSPYTAFVAIEEWRDEHTGRAQSTSVQVPIHLPQGTHCEAFEPPQQVMYAAAMPSAPSRRGRMTSKHAAPDSAAHSEFGGGMHMLATSPQPASKSRVSPGHGSSRQETSRTPAQQAADALRYLARTQAVSGAWAASEIATALALLAFVRHGHSDRTGSFRPQLTRTVRWLSDHARQPGTSPVVAWALAELAAVTGAEAHIAARDAALANAASSDELEQSVVLRAQQTTQGSPQPVSGLPEGNNLAAWLADERSILALVVRASGNSDAAAQIYTTLAQYMQADDRNAGAVVPPGHRDRTPEAVVFAATAAAALVAP
jgi:Ca-activated chloride channel family protein